MDRSREWSTRIVHEAQSHDRSAFLTLTFSEEHLPADYSISVRHLQLFMKRLRKAKGPTRFFGCGEYGSRLGRPHYHVLVFGQDFAEDRYAWRQSPTGHPLYRSPLLEKLWPYGHSEIGSVTSESAAYVARYIMKKVNGDQARDYYTRTHPVTGEVVQVRPEFICMSTKPGIGASWYDQYASDAFPSDFVIVEGSKRPVPRYYKKKLAAASVGPLPSSMELSMATRRASHARSHQSDNTPERLAVREESQTLRAQHLKREME